MQKIYLPDDRIWVQIICCKYKYYWYYKDELWVWVMPQGTGFQWWEYMVQFQVTYLAMVQDLGAMPMDFHDIVLNCYETSES